MVKIIKEDKEIKDMVYMIRGQQVMLDSDLSSLYGYTVKRLNEQVRRNKERFPNDFMFQLTMVEATNVSRSRFATLNKQGNNIKYAPFVFTEQGIYMLTAVLKSEIAIQQSILIMRAFKEMRHYIAENQSLLNNTDLLKLSSSVVDQEKRIATLESNMATKSDIDKIMDNFIDESNIKDITILNGHKFEAIEAYTKIYKRAHRSIYIIDDYINIDTLTHLKCKQSNVDVVLFLDNKGNGAFKLRQLELDAFNALYPSLSLKSNGIVHDRYIIIDYKTDNEKIYHCGASSKDAGKKVCGINEINDRLLLHSVIDKLLLQHMKTKKPSFLNIRLTRVLN